MLSPEIKKQVKTISAAVLAMGLVQLGVFLVLSFTAQVSFAKALAGTAAGCLAAVLNLVLLAVSVEKSVAKSSRGAQAHMTLAYMGRLLLTAAEVIAVIKLPGIFNLWAAVIPLVFPRIAIMLINFKSKRKGGELK